MSAVVRAARSYLGAPWRHLGRSAAGIDCIGLVVLAHWDAGQDVPDPQPYPREPSGHRIIAGLTEAGARRVRAGEERDGDVLLFRVAGVGGHVGIRATHPMLNVASVIHAYQDRGRVVEEPLMYELADALIGAWRREG